MNEEAPPVQESPSVETIGIHLSYLRRDTKSNSDELKKITAKLDSMNTAFVTVQEYVHFKEFAEKGFATKEEIKPYFKQVDENASDIKKLTEFKDTLAGKMWGIGILAGALSSILGIIISHYWK